MQITVSIETGYDEVIGACTRIARRVRTMIGQWKIARGAADFLMAAANGPAWRKHLLRFLYTLQIFMRLRGWNAKP